MSDDTPVAVETERHLPQILEPEFVTIEAEEALANREISVRFGEGAPGLTLSPSDDRPEITVEAIAMAAYTLIAEELRWKGDFPAWDAITDRAREAYIKSVEYVRQSMTTDPQTKLRTRFEEIVYHNLTPKE